MEDTLNTARMETVTLTIATENASLRAQFVRNTLCQVVRFLLIGHCLLVAFGAIFEEGSSTLISDIFLSANITLVYCFLVATFAQYTSIDFTSLNDQSASCPSAQCVSTLMWMSIFSIEINFSNHNRPFASFVVTMSSTILAVSSQAGLLFFIQALHGNRLEEFNIGDATTAIVTITLSIATFYLCILSSVYFSHDEL